MSSWPRDPRSRDGAADVGDVGEGVHHLSWEQARRTARTACAPVAPISVPLEVGAGEVLAADALALTGLPATTTSAMDGWAVAGSGPWTVRGEVLAGRRWDGAALGEGEAVRIATGAQLPDGATAVLRREFGVESADVVRAMQVLTPGADVREAGQECRAGDVVLPAGVALSPVGIGLLAAAGLDQVWVRRVSVDVLVLGDELLRSGPARDARLRDALGPLLSQWLPARGAHIASRRHVPDTEQALHRALDAALGDVVVTTGSTARGPVDHLHDVLDQRGARWLIDGVRVRPGHPMLLALLADGRALVGLPGNPLAAVSALLTLVDPLLGGLRGLPPAAPQRARLAVDVDAGPHATRLLPIRDGRPVTYAGPAMLRGLAQAEHVAVIPPGGARVHTEVEVLALT